MSVATARSHQESVSRIRVYTPPASRTRIVRHSGNNRPDAEDRRRAAVHEIAIVPGTVYHQHAMEILERLLPSYWWTDPSDAIGGPLWAAFAALLGLVLVIGVAAWLLAPRLAAHHSLHRRLIVRAAKCGVGFAVSGLFILLFRWQQTPFLSKRLWLFVWLASVVAAAAIAQRYRTRIYPTALAAWDDDARRRRYLPKPATGKARSRRRGRRHP